MTDASAHRLWILRHGQSLANVEGVIVSAPGPRALEQVGLSGTGREQVRATAARTVLGPDTVLVSSDFARAVQTAGIAAQAWGTGPVRTDPRLRERFFGVLDEGPDTAYDAVWAADRGEGPLPEGVETVESVAARTRELVEELLAAPGRHDVVLVAHGDVLQIAQAWAAGRNPHEHRDLPHLATAELRRIL